VTKTVSIQQSIHSECPRPPSLDIMKRPAEGQVGRRVNLLSNHFRVSFAHIPDLFHYNMTISRSERDSPDPRYVTNKSICRKIMEKVKEFPELNVKNFSYDGDKSMFTMGRLTERQMEFKYYLTIFKKKTE
jgi:eukaryotic translation initiation factor 2C